MTDSAESHKERMKRPLEVDVDQISGLAKIEISSEEHGWTIETMVENSRGYIGEGVEAVTSRANCYVSNPEALRSLAEYLSEKADEMEENDE